MSFLKIAKDDQEPIESKGTGIGTDIFVRKVKPGASIGEGYFVDVYDNGVKIDSLRKNIKKDVVEVIRQYKKQYHTDRAFQNEEQLHVTYKTKEQRGEQAMENIDQELIKKANLINVALQKLMTPELPIKIRQADMTMEGVLPQTPGPEVPMDENSIGTSLAVKFVQFVMKNQPQQGNEWAKNDIFYNPFKKMLAAFKKEITNYQKTNNAQLNLKAIADSCNAILLSGDPVVIKKLAGIDVTPDAAAKIKEIASMKSGTEKKASVEELEEGNLSDAVEKEVNSEFGGKEDSEEKKIEASYKDIFSEDSIDPLCSAFWKYAKNINKVANLDNVFVEWANINEVDAETSNKVWVKINKEIEDGFTKEAEVKFVMRFTKDISKEIEDEFIKAIEAFRSGADTFNVTYDYIDVILKKLIDVAIDSLRDEMITNGKTLVEAKRDMTKAAGIHRFIQDGILLVINPILKRYVEENKDISGQLNKLRSEIIGNIQNLDNTSVDDWSNTIASITPEQIRNAPKY